VASDAISDAREGALMRGRLPAEPWPRQLCWPGALELDPSLAEAHVWLGLVHWWYDQDVDATLRELRTALAMEPDLVTAHQWYGSVLVTVGRFDEGIAETRRAHELDPLAPNVATFMGLNLVFAGRNDAAIEQLRTATTVQRDKWWAHALLARAYARAGRFPEALAAARQAKQLSKYAEIESVLGRVLADAGDRAEATKVLDHLRERARHEFVPPPYFTSRPSSSDSSGSTRRWSSSPGRRKRARIT
jgi:tetratricopeptide (TPR) repeat protein